MQLQANDSNPSHWKFIVEKKVMTSITVQRRRNHLFFNLFFTPRFNVRITIHCLRSHPFNLTTDGWVSEEITKRHVKEYACTRHFPVTCKKIIISLSFRRHLIREETIKFYSEALVTCGQATLEVAYNACGTLSHIMSDQNSQWPEALEPQKILIAKKMIDAVKEWDETAERNINYRSLSVRKLSRYYCIPSSYRKNMNKNF